MVLLWLSTLLVLSFLSFPSSQPLLYISLSFLPFFPLFSPSQCPSRICTFNLFCLNAINGQTHITHTNTCAHTDMHSFTQPTFSLSHYDTHFSSLSSPLSLSSLPSLPSLLLCLSSLSLLPPLSLELSFSISLDLSLSTLAPLSLADTNEHLQAHFASHMHAHTHTHTHTHRTRQVCTHTHPGCLSCQQLAPGVCPSAAVFVDSLL